MKFCATEMPIATPIPAEPPTPAATDTAATVEAMLEVLEAPMFTSSALTSTLFWAYAFVFVSTTFCATAPAPLMAMPAVPPNPSAIDAAAEIALMVFFVTLIVLGAISSSTKVSPSGAASDQDLPATSVVRRSLSMRSQLALSA